jgi:ATP-dependent RNA helicase DDX24/MAK5
MQVFVNAVSAVRRLAALLRLLGLPATALHAQQQQRQRLRALDRFRSHPHGVLVATDVAARGLDIPDVQARRHTCQSMQQFTLR